MSNIDDIRTESANIKEFLKKLREKHSDIIAHKEDDWDWTWADEGYDAMEDGDFDLAEYKFEQLIVSQPDHFEGYEGLAEAYNAQGRKTEACMLIDHAIKLAKTFLKIDGLDKEALDDMLAAQLRIHDK